MKRLVITLALVACFLAGAVSHRLYVGKCTHELAESLREGQELLADHIAPAQETRTVAALRATVDTLWMVRKLEAEEASREVRAAKYGDELLGRMGDVRQTLNSTEKYGNEYAVQKAFDRANKMLEDMGSDALLQPYF